MHTKLAPQGYFAYYAAALFLGVVFSFAIFRQMPGSLFFPALAIMAAGTWFSVTDKPAEET